MGVKEVDATVYSDFLTKTASEGGIVVKPTFYSTSSSHNSWNWYSFRRGDTHHHYSSSTHSPRPPSFHSSRSSSSKDAGAAVAILALIAGVSAFVVTTHKAFFTVRDTYYAAQRSFTSYFVSNQTKADISFLTAELNVVKDRTEKRSLLNQIDQITKVSQLADRRLSLGNQDITYNVCYLASLTAGVTGAIFLARGGYSAYTPFIEQGCGLLLGGGLAYLATWYFDGEDRDIERNKLAIKAQSLFHEVHGNFTLPQRLYNFVCQLGHRIIDSILEAASSNRSSRDTHPWLFVN